MMIQKIGHIPVRNHQVKPKTEAHGGSVLGNRVNLLMDTYETVKQGQRQRQVDDLYLESMSSL